jgi:uncharacterized tellurite resistance protein B-like protein
VIPFASNATLTPSQIAAAAQAMLKLAHVDGEKTQEEIALIRAFYESCAQEQDLPPFQGLLDKAAGQATLTPVLFPEAGQRELVVSFSIMVGFADGVLSAAERNAVLDISRQLGVSDDRFDQLIREVKDQLLAQLSRLPDAPSVAKVAQELG